MDNYRSTLIGECLGWALFSSVNSFSYIHRVLVDPEAGPVIVVADEVLEVDADDEVFATDEAARDAYWAAKTAS